ncbi:hypothetical protein RCZ04_17130 [Capnocytophaga sp. HP1101]
MEREKGDNIHLFTYFAGADFLQRGRCDGGQMTRDEENLPLFTYSALADYLVEGECGDGKEG